MASCKNDFLCTLGIFKKRPAKQNQYNFNFLKISLRYLKRRITSSVHYNTGKLVCLTFSRHIPLGWQLLHYTLTCRYCALIACVAGAWKWWAQQRNRRARETWEGRGSTCLRSPWKSFQFAFWTCGNFYWLGGSQGDKSKCVREENSIKQNTRSLFCKHVVHGWTMQWRFYTFDFNYNTTKR